MAKPIDPSLNYFSISTGFTKDRKIRRLMAKYNADGPLVYIQMLELIYGDKGYFLEWDNGIPLDISYDLKWIKEETINEIILYCMDEKVGLFDKGLYDKHNIITSRGIQKRWSNFMIKLRRKSDINSEFNLLNDEDTGVNDDKNTVNDFSKTFIHRKNELIVSKERMYSNKTEILKIFYFKGFKYNQEFEKFEKYFNQNGFTFNGDKVDDWAAVAEKWKPSLGYVNVSKELLVKWNKVYLVFKKMHPDIEKNGLPTMLKMYPKSFFAGTTEGDILQISCNKENIPDLRNNYYNDWLIAVSTVFGNVKVEFAY